MLRVESEVMVDEVFLREKKNKGHSMTIWMSTIYGRPYLERGDDVHDHAVNRRARDAEECSEGSVGQCKSHPEEEDQDLGEMIDAGGLIS